MTGADARTDEADLVLRNGRIYTIDRARSWASALAVKNGRILAVGEDAAMARHIGPSTQMVDLGGRMAMPGIVDVHNHHFIGGMAELYELRFAPTPGLREVLEKVREAASQVRPDEWVIGGLWGSSLMEEIDNLDALAAFDEASLGRAVLLRDDTYHNRWANSLALKLAGIGPETPDPDQGEIKRDAATGRPTGILIEAGSRLVEAAAARLSPFSVEQEQAAAAQAIATLNAYGVTAFLDAATMQYMLAALKGLDDRGALTAWAVASLPAVEPGFLFGPSGDELIALRENYRSPHLKPDFVKIFLDGVPPQRTAAFVEPYLPDPIRGCCFRGATKMSLPELARWIGKCEAQNIGVKIHCAGDAAVRQALDAVDVVRSFNGPTEIVHHIAHASYIQDDDIPRFAELGVAADLSPIIWYPTQLLEAMKVTLGAERGERFWPNRDLLAAGALMAAGSDWPVVANPDPWNGIEGMVTRRNPDGSFLGKALWPEQALDLATVLEIYTINSARALRIADVTGSLEIGKSADIIVLDRNVFDIPEDDIAETKVLSTYFEGRKVFERS
jgi:predicted amidohydrolase YtcJ